MDVTNLVGWTVTVLLIAGGVLRWLTVWVNDATFRLKLPRASPTTVPQLARRLFPAIAFAAAVVSVGGALFLPYPGLWGPAVLVFSVIWDINAGWKVRHLPWVAPVEYGLRDGSRIVLLGGALGTLIAYVVTLPL